MSFEGITYLPQVLGSRLKDGILCPCGEEKVSEGAIEVEDGSTVEHKTSAVSVDFECSDEILMIQLQNGVRDALTLLFRRHAVIVRNVSYRILRNEAEADDLVQDVFLFIFRRAALFDASRGSARSWIIQVAYHRAFDRRRHLNTRRFYVSHELDDAAATARDRRYEEAFCEWSLEGVWGRESAAKLREILSAGQLATIELHFFEGYTLEEVADRLGQTLGNVRNHYYRALEKLRKPAFAGKLRSK